MAQRFKISYIYGCLKSVLKTTWMIYLIFSGLSLLTLVIVCVAEPNVEEAITSDTVNTETREGKSKF